MTLTRRSFLTRTTATLAAPTLIGSVSATPALAQSASGAPLGGDIQRFRVGGIEVTALWDGYAPLPNAMIAGFEPEAAKAAAHAAYKPYDPQMFSVSINGYLIRSGDRLIAVDTGAPAPMAPTVGRWHQSLALAGVSADQIDTVFLTHAHGDHVGGLADLTTGAQSALLPNAEVVLSEAEWAFTFDDAVLAAVPEAFRENFMASRALLSPYAAARRELAATRETEIAPGVTAVPAPGHTPGHMGLRITDGDDSLLIWGDAIHATAYQFANPDWSVLFDADPAQAAATRAGLLDMAASTRLRVAGMHHDFPSLGYVEHFGSAYRYIGAPGDTAG